MALLITHSRISCEYVHEIYIVFTNLHEIDQYFANTFSVWDASFSQMIQLNSVGIYTICCMYLLLIIGEPKNPYNWHIGLALDIVV